MFPESNRTKFSCFADQNGPKEDPLKMNIDNFKCKNEIPKQLRLEKQMKKKMELLDLFSYFVPELWSLNYQKLCPFCYFLLMSAKNLKLL